jgi:chitinase
MLYLKPTLVAVFLAFSLSTYAQIASHNLVGYWHNWNSANAPYIALDQVDSRYSIIEVSFALPTSATDMTMRFTPSGTTQAAFISKIQATKAQGRKVLISVGGGGTTVDLTTVANKTAFINSMTTILSTYGFDGMDIDIEGGNSILNASGGTTTTPTNPGQIHIIEATKQIMVNYRAANSNRKMLLTMAPETAYVQGGQSSFNTFWGAYLPIIHALRDSLDLLQVQLYNSGSMYGLDRAIYTQGTADFIVALTEASIRGFNTAGGFFTGLPAHKIALGLPACTSAAGGGYTSEATVRAAVRYLLGTGPKPGSYTLLTSGGYPTLNGMMTWSVNWDAVATCGGAYTYAANYETLFNGSVPVELKAFWANIVECSETPNCFGKGTNAQLSWETASELNLKDYDIEKSIDGKNFVEIDKIAARNAPSVYAVVDKNFEQSAYYRLKTNELSGDVAYSKIVFLEKQLASSIKMSRNTEGSILIDTKDVIEQVMVFNTIGQVVMTGKTASFSLQNLSKGMYIVSVKTNRAVLTQKIIIGN